MLTRFAFTLLIVVFIGCKSSQVALPISQNNSAYVKFIGERILPHRMDYRGTMFGGISGMDYDGKNTYYLLSDDGAQYGPIRYYTASMEYTDSTFLSLDINGVEIFKQETGIDYPGIKEADSIYADPEAMRLDIANKRLIWVSEGYRNNFKQDPYVFVHGLNGQHMKKLHPGERYSAKKEDWGPRHNGVFEGVSMSANNDQIWVSTEQALYQDGSVATHVDGGAPVRIFKMDLNTGERLIEYPYQIEPIFTPVDSGVFGMTGVVELLWLENERFLIMERAYVKDKGNKVRVYLVDFKGVSNILSIERLSDKNLTLPAKKLIIDFDDYPLAKVDNIEAFCWGKNLPNGNRTLIFASDDNFGKDQVTQFILFEVLKPF